MIAVNDDGLQRGKRDVEIQRFLAGSEQIQRQHDQPPLNKNLNHMRAGARQPVHGFHRMVDGMDRHLVVHKENYAYVPIHGHLDQGYFRACYSNSCLTKNRHLYGGKMTGISHGHTQDHNFLNVAECKWSTLTR